MVPYYKKFHTFHPASKKINDQLGLDSYMDLENQGTHGPVSATYAAVYGPFNEAWMAAFKGVGFDDNTDPILGRKLGAFMPPNSIDPKENKRSYSASAYYSKEIESRPNLDLLTETQVTKVIWDGSEGGVVANGVQICRKDGSVAEVTADEVILAAGALQSPQILENSGIGSKEILERHGVEVVVDNPGVGENLQDHCFTTVSFEVADGQISADVVRDPAVVEALVKLYEETKTGPLSGVPFSLAYVPPVDINGRMRSEAVASLIDAYTDVDKSNPSWMKAQYAELHNIMLDPNESTCFYGLMPSQMHVQAEGKTSMQQAYSPQLPQNYITIMVGLNHPFSRGSVHIGGSNPRSDPKIDPGYLSHPLDLEILARGTQFIEKIADHPAMKQLLKTESRLPSGVNLTDLESAKRVAEDRLWTTYHSSCTCPMMPRELGGVVNDRLVVHGTKNVRVIDASIFPMITLGNIQATVYAVAERACDLIKQDWSKQ
jgi:choline dehydrogenase-like flavoprotein